MSLVGDKSVWPYLWNLLPENPNVLQRWAQQYHVSAGDPFKLLGHVGADVPAARSSVLMLDEPYIIVERYDRLPLGGGNRVPAMDSSRGWRARDFADHYTHQAGERRPRG
jgi:hypothetical protein